MARGKSRGHKGGRKQFSNPDQIKQDLAKEEEKRLWREQHPDSESEESEAEAEVKTRGGRGARGGAKKKEESDSEVEFGSGSEEESSSEEEDENAKKKGVEGLIELENPNRVKQKMKKVSQLTDPTVPAASAAAATAVPAAVKKTPAADKPQLSRREREEIEKQKAKAHYQKLHAAGKTDEAKADLARLAIIRKQREEAAAKRAAELQAKEDASKAKQDGLAKALGKK